MNTNNNLLTTPVLTGSQWEQLPYQGTYRLINSSQRSFPQHLTRSILRASLATLWQQLCPQGVVCRAPRQHNNLILGWPTTAANRQSTTIQWMGAYLFAWKQSQPTAIDFHTISAIYDYPVLMTTNNHNLATIISQLQAETFTHPWTIITVNRCSDAVMEFNFTLVPVPADQRLQSAPLTYLQVMNKKHLLQVLTQYTSQHPEWSLAHHPWASANKQTIIDTLLHHLSAIDEAAFHQLYNQELLCQQQGKKILPVVTWLPLVP